MTGDYRGLSIAVYRIRFSTYRIAHHGADVVKPSKAFGMASEKPSRRDPFMMTAGVRKSLPLPWTMTPSSPPSAIASTGKAAASQSRGDTAFTPGTWPRPPRTVGPVWSANSCRPRMVKILENSARKAGNRQQGQNLQRISRIIISALNRLPMSQRTAGVGMLAFTHIVPSVPKPLEFALTGDAAVGAFCGANQRSCMMAMSSAFRARDKFKTQNLLSR